MTNCLVSKSRLFAAAGIICFGLCVFSHRARAGGLGKIGPVDIQFGKFVLSGGVFHGFDGIIATTPEYTIDADDILVLSDTTHHVGIESVTATGNTLAHTQVNISVVKYSAGQKYTILADKAVYVPTKVIPFGAKTRPTGRIDCTGNVMVTVSDAQALSEPAHLTVNSATIFLGPKPEYPRVDGEQGHITAMPLQ